MKASGRIGLHGCKWPLLAAAGVRLALLCATLLRSGTAVITSGDTASYLEPGRNLLLHGQFITGVTPELDRTPGYPLFLALISLHGAALAAFLQVIVSVLSVLLVARLAMALFADERVAILAAWLFAFEPVSVIFSVRLLAETLFLALILLSLERLAVFLRDHRL
jgi:Gpi18-like mannosyltransferase